MILTICNTYVSGVSTLQSKKNQFIRMDCILTIAIDQFPPHLLIQLSMAAIFDIAEGLVRRDLYTYRSKIWIKAGNNL